MSFKDMSKFGAPVAVKSDGTAKVEPNAKPTVNASAEGVPAPKKS
jgi:hypothetical protein